MSLNFLKRLNGKKRGGFSKYLKSLDPVPRIAWYPSAGHDFRDLLYLNPAYCRLKPTKNDPKPPEFFLHTDYYPWGETIFFLDNEMIYKDDRTSIVVEQVEELPTINLPLSPELVRFKEKTIATGRVFFLRLRVQSSILGEARFPIIYAYLENAAFCAKYAIPTKAKFSHIIHIRI